MTLCNVPPPTEYVAVHTVQFDINALRLKWVFNAYDELLQLWCYAQDLDSFEHAGTEFVTFLAGDVRYPYLTAANDFLCVASDQRH